MTFSVEVKGVEGAMKHLQSKKGVIDSKVTSALHEAVGYTESEVKNSIAGRRAEPRSVDTGQFLGSIQGTVSKGSGIVFSNVPHSLFLEYGTTHIPARRHFQNSSFRAKERIKNYFELHVRSAANN